MVSITTLKKSSKDIDRITQEINKLNSNNKREEDTRFWKVERDKAGNGAAIIRFLPTPAVDGDDGMPWVRYWDHAFKGPTGKWYFENSLTTLNKKDPLSDYNSRLWNLSSDDKSPERKQAREQKRRLHYISNIYVVSDPKNPVNEGKVFLWKYGKKVFDKIKLAMEPEFEGDAVLNPFDLWKGANFRLRIRVVDGYPNYDQSSFESPNVLLPSDDQLEKVWNGEYSLKEFIAPDKFKTYEELHKKLTDVMGFDPLSDEPNITRKAAAPVKKQVAKAVSDEDDVPWNTDDDDELARFKALAEE